MEILKFKNCRYCLRDNENCECLFRCSLCGKEFDYMPSDGMHSVRDYIPDIGDIDGECGPVYRV